MIRVKCKYFVKDNIPGMKCTLYDMGEGKNNKYKGSCRDRRIEGRCIAYVGVKGNSFTTCDREFELGWIEYIKYNHLVTLIK